MISSSANAEEKSVEPVKTTENVPETKTKLSNGNGMNKNGNKGGNVGGGTSNGGQINKISRKESSKARLRPLLLPPN